MWFTVLLIIASYEVVDQGIFEWFLEHFSSPVTLTVSAGMVLIFFAVYLFLGLPVGWMLQQEYVAVAKLEEELAAAKGSAAAVVRRVLSEQYNGPAIAKSTFRRLGKFLSYGSNRPLDADMLAVYYEDHLRDKLDSLEHYRQLLFHLGLLGTVGGVVYALASGTIPQTAEEVRAFSLTTLEGLGVSYTSTFFGMGGALILFLLGGRYEKWAAETCSTQREFLEEVLLIVESKQYSDTDAS